tara:strand:+ start:3612 stop:5990 length:2379 start_codon:yes stop_codon:yes gene_type:complete
MIISIEWLKEFIDIKESNQDLADILSSIGLEAELNGIPQSLEGVITAKVESIKSHPNADRLKICIVNDGIKNFQVVCGAPNVDKGQTIAFAKVGSVLPGNFKIKKAKIRGVDSIGMICSEKELLISDEHDGIFILPNKLDIGQNFIDAYGYKYFSIELDLTPNRPDALSHQGVARDIATKTGRKFNPIQIKSVKPVDNLTLNISIEDQNDCPRYICAIVDNVNVSSSPEWMVERLKAAGQRSVNNIVDISNYVMLEIGQPTHIFDFDKLKRKEIFVRRAVNGEKLTTLDEIEHDLKESQLIITDGKKPIALAGVMGGLDTAVTKNTKKILVESANFNSVTIRKGAKIIQAITDASKRFERGMDPESAEIGFWRVIELLNTCSNGKLVSEKIDQYPKQIKNFEITLRRVELDLILGYRFKKSKIEEIMEGLEINSTWNGKDEWKCIPPLFRPDLEREIDIIEEIARMVGYDKIPSDENIYGTFKYSNPDPEKNINFISETLAGMGFHQVYTNSLQNKFESTLINNKPVKIMNPINQEMGYLRTSLIPGLLKISNYNKKNGKHNFRLFELSKVHEQKTKGLKGIKEKLLLTGIIHGLKDNFNIHNISKKEDIYTLKGYLYSLFTNKLKIKFDLNPSEIIGYDYGQIVLLNGIKSGIMGKLSPHIITKLNLDIQNVFCFELNLNSIMKNLVNKRKFIPINPYPKITRDLNLVMPESQFVDPLIKTILKYGNNLILSVRPENIFRDDSSIGDGNKSVTFSITFQHHSKTLEDKDVNPIIDSIINIVNKIYNAKLRA